MADVIVVADLRVEGSIVLLPMTRRGSSSSSDTVRTAEEVVRGAEEETGTEEVMVLPALSVVVIAELLEGVADVSVSSASSVAEVSEGWLEVGEADGVVVSSSSVEVVGSASEVVGPVVGSDVVSGSSVVGAEVVALVSEVVGSSEVVSGVEVGSTELLVVTPVPTTCRFGMTPRGRSWAWTCAKPTRAENMTDEGRMVGDIVICYVVRVRRWQASLEYPNRLNCF